MSELSGHIIGIDLVDNGRMKVYHILLSSYNPTAKDKQWRFSIDKVPERNLIGALRSNKIVLKNARLDGNKLVGTTGSLERFTPKSPIANSPVVIISEIKVKGSPDRLVGYKVASKNSGVKNIKLDAMIAHCASVTKRAKETNSDAVPVQNYVYDGNRRILRQYSDGQSIVEYTKVNKPAKASPANVDKEANKKQLSKLEEIFNKQQIQELRLGKSKGLDIRIYGNNKLSAEQMRAIREALEDGVDARAFASPAFSADVMKAYATNMKYGVDVRDFILPEYSVGQIYEISTAWLEGVDISKLADPKIKVDDMAKIRIELEQQLYNEVQVSVIDIINQYDRGND